MSKERQLHEAQLFLESHGWMSEDDSHVYAHREEDVMLEILDTDEGFEIAYYLGREAVGGEAPPHYVQASTIKNLMNKALNEINRKLRRKVETWARIEQALFKFGKNSKQKKQRIADRRSIVAFRKFLHSRGFEEPKFGVREKRVPRARSSNGQKTIMLFDKGYEKKTIKAYIEIFYGSQRPSYVVVAFSRISPHVVSKPRPIPVDKKGYVHALDVVVRAMMEAADKHGHAKVHSAMYKEEAWGISEKNYLSAFDLVADGLRNSGYKAVENMRIKKRRIVKVDGARLYSEGWVKHSDKLKFMMVVSPREESQGKYSTDLSLRVQMSGKIIGEYHHSVMETRKVQKIMRTIKLMEKGAMREPEKASATPQSVPGNAYTAMLKMVFKAAPKNLVASMLKFVEEQGEDKLYKMIRVIGRQEGLQRARKLNSSSKLSAAQKDVRFAIMFAVAAADDEILPAKKLHLLLRLLPKRIGKKAMYDVWTSIKNIVIPVGDAKLSTQGHYGMRRKHYERFFAGAVAPRPKRTPTPAQINALQGKTISMHEAKENVTAATAEYYSEKEYVEKMVRDDHARLKAKQDASAKFEDTSAVDKDYLSYAKPVWDAMKGNGFAKVSKAVKGVVYVSVRNSKLSEDELKALIPADVFQWVAHEETTNSGAVIFKCKFDNGLGGKGKKKQLADALDDAAKLTRKLKNQIDTASIELALKRKVGEFNQPLNSKLQKAFKSKRAKGAKVRLSNTNKGVVYVAVRHHDRLSEDQILDLFPYEIRTAKRVKAIKDDSGKEIGDVFQCSIGKEEASMTRSEKWVDSLPLKYSQFSLKALLSLDGMSLSDLDYIPGMKLTGGEFIMRMKKSHTPEGYRGYEVKFVYVKDNKSYVIANGPIRGKQKTESEHEYMEFLVKNMLVRAFRRFSKSTASYTEESDFGAILVGAAAIFLYGLVDELLEDMVAKTKLNMAAFNKWYAYRVPKQAQKKGQIYYRLNAPTKDRLKSVTLATSPEGASISETYSLSLNNAPSSLRAAVRAFGRKVIKANRDAKREAERKKREAKRKSHASMSIDGVNVRLANFKREK